MSNPLVWYNPRNLPLNKIREQIVVLRPDGTLAEWEDGVLVVQDLQMHVENYNLLLIQKFNPVPVVLSGFHCNTGLREVELNTNLSKAMKLNVATLVNIATTWELDKQYECWIVPSSMLEKGLLLTAWKVHYMQCAPNNSYTPYTITTHATSCSDRDLIWVTWEKYDEGRGQLPTTFTIDQAYHFHYAYKCKHAGVGIPWWRPVFAPPLTPVLITPEVPDNKEGLDL